MWMVLNSLLYCSPLSSVQLLSRVRLFVTPWTEPARLPCPSPTPGACSNSCPLSRWCHPIISSSVVPFCLQSFPASGPFLMRQLFALGGQSIEASASVLLMNILDWFPLGLTGLIFLQSKGLSRVFSNTTVQKHQFLDAQLSLWLNSHIHVWLLKKSYPWVYGSLYKYTLCVLCIFVYTHTYIHRIIYGKITQISASLKFCIVWRCFCFSLPFLLSILTPTLEIPSSLAHS